MTHHTAMFAEVRPKDGSEVVSIKMVLPISADAAKVDPLDPDAYYKSVKPLLECMLDPTNPADPVIRLLGADGTVLYDGPLMGNAKKLANLSETVSAAWPHIECGNCMLAQALVNFTDICITILRAHAVLGPGASTEAKTRMYGALSSEKTIIAGVKDDGTEMRVETPVALRSQGDGRQPSDYMPVVDQTKAEHYAMMRVISLDDVIFPAPKSGMVSSSRQIFLLPDAGGAIEFRDVTDEDKQRMAACGIPAEFIAAVEGAYLFPRVGSPVQNTDNGVFIGCANDLPVFVRRRASLTPVPGYYVPVTLYSAINGGKQPDTIIGADEANAYNNSVASKVFGSHAVQSESRH